MHIRVLPRVCTAWNVNSVHSHSSDIDLSCRFVISCLKKHFDFSGAADQWCSKRTDHVVQWLEQSMPVAKRSQQRAELSSEVVDDAVTLVWIMVHGRWTWPVVAQACDLCEPVNHLVLPFWVVIATCSTQIGYVYRLKTSLRPRRLVYQPCQLARWKMNSSGYNSQEG